MAIGIAERKKRRKHRIRKHAHKPKPTPTPPKPTTPVAGAVIATSRERLYLNRFGTGFSQRSLAKLRAASTPEAWLTKQLSPTSVAELANQHSGSSAGCGRSRASPTETC